MVLMNHLANPYLKLLGSAEDGFMLLRWFVFLTFHGGYSEDKLINGFMDEVALQIHGS